MHGTYQLEVFTCWNLNCKIKIWLLKKWVKRIFNCFKRKLCIPVLQDIYFFEKKPRSLHIFSFTCQRVSLICIVDEYFCCALFFLYIGNSLLNWTLSIGILVMQKSRYKWFSCVSKMLKLFFKFSSSIKLHVLYMYSVALRAHWQTSIVYVCLLTLYKVNK